MPLPMVHLAVAVQMHARCQRTLSPEFLLGSLAPDAIHARPATTREDKNRTHFHFTGDHDAFLTQVQKYLADQLVTQTDLPARAFAAGYATHVLTDSVWAMTVYARFRRGADAQVDLEARRALYYQETEKVDFLLYHGEPWRETVWAALCSARAFAVPDLLSAAEVSQWQEHTLSWFDQHKEPAVQPRFITETIVREFIVRVTDALLAQWRIWGYEFAPQ